jgi:hypothetical protein
MLFRPAILFILGIVTAPGAIAQPGPLRPTDTTLSSRPVSSGYLDKVSAKAEQLEQKLDKKSTKTLQQFQKQEARIKRKLARLDSLKARQIFGDAEARYIQLEQKLQNTGSLKQYIPSLDTLSTSLQFLQQNPQLLSQTKEAQQKLKEALGKLGGLEGRFQKAEEIKKFLKERRQYLRAQLSQRNIGRFTKAFKQLNKQAYYYSQQLNEYKALLKDHTKAEKKALALLSKTKLFRDFMRKNSQLASLFRLPGDPNDPAAQVNLAGLQTRAQVNNLIQQQLAAGGSGAWQQLQQNLQQAQSQLDQLKSKMSRLGAGPAGNSDDLVPEGFKPNNQKTKSFLQRLELGTNIQSQKASGYFPVTSDIGLSVGYKLNDKSIVGIGASYKLGLGQDIRHINLTHQGAGLRSFVDWKIKGSWWVSGGYEMNYRSRFSSIAQLQNLNQWQQSGLVGMSKVVSLKTKFFKKTKLQLLWDMLSYQQVPRGQPVVFRVGYSLK